GARVEVAPYKRNPMDFVLWKPSSQDLPGWDSPWGRGRPGWHIECSAMSAALLGPSFDIHGGGIDLQFPHHENELAQSCCAHPDADFAQVWLHNEMLQVEGRKMSKSLGNFFTVRDLLDRGVPGEVIRFVMLSTHYRKPMDWTEAKAEEAGHILEGWFNMTDGVEATSAADPLFMEALADDLNTAAALTRLSVLSKHEQAPALKASLRVLGFPDAEDIDWWRKEIVTLPVVGSTGNTPLHLEVIGKLLEEMQEARLAKDYATADKLREAMVEAGLGVKIGATGPSATVPKGFDVGRLKELIQQAE
ncbi:MAG: class I tRNA ligase family protein, partial [Paracoccus sp. (in: a-proteobacteria)]